MRDPKFDKILRLSQAGFDYNSIEMEKEAFAQESVMDTLLIQDPGRQFLSVYNSKGLQTSLGLPTATTYSNLGRGTYELPFETGVLDITCTGANPPVCT
jgi:hypothetical protein